MFNVNVEYLDFVIRITNSECFEQCRAFLHE